MVVGFAMPHHHHQAIFCVTEHHCDNEADTDLVFHDHETSDHHSDSDDTFCIAHELFRLPNGINFGSSQQTTSTLCAVCHHIHHCFFCQLTLFNCEPFLEKFPLSNSNLKGIKPLRAPPVCA